MKAFRQIKVAFVKVFAANDWRPMRRRDAVERYVALSGDRKHALDNFNELVAEGFIVRRQSWFALARRPEPLFDPQPAPTPQEVTDMRNLVVRHFPRTGQSNPFHFCIVAGLNPEPERLVVVRAAFRELVKDGFLEKLAADEEYAWCGPVEEAPFLRPAMPVPPTFVDAITRELEQLPKKMDAWAGSNPVVGSDEWHFVRATSEALCREVVWRLAQRRVPGPCAEALMQALEFAPGTKGEEP